MPQSSYAYAVARIRALERSLFGKDRIARLAEGSLDDVVRMLNEAGYGDMSDASAQDCETMIAKEMEKAKKLVQEITPEPEISNLFLMKADIHNIKVLIKARLIDLKEEPLLLDGGIFPKEKLITAVRDHDYRDLPQVLKEELNALEKSLQSKENPQHVSVALDRAYLIYAQSTLNRHKNAFAESYFRALADFNNVLALLRVRSMDAGKEALASVLLPPGDVSHSAIIAAFDQPFEALTKLVATGAAGGAIADGLSEVSRTGQNSMLEKARDNYLMQLVKKNKYDVMTLQPILGYYLAREQEAECIRLIVTAKRNGLDGHVITERLREAYV